MERKKKKLANSVLGGGAYKTKKAFTLIELLAIIVILAIIAVITVPIILNVIENSKKGAAKDSAYGYKDAINKYYVSELYENQNLKLNGTYTITDKGELSDGTNVYEIPFTGTIPTGGYLYYENNVLTDGCITMDEYSVTLSNGEMTIVEKGSCPKAITIVSQKEEGKIQTGDELAINTEHFYVVSSDAEETVLLAKYNLNVGNNTQDEAYGKIGMQNSLAIGFNSDSSTKDENGNYPATGIAFSSINYWDGKVGDEFTYPGSYSGSDYPNVYDDNSNLYNYVQAYKTNLEKLGANIKDTRLLTYQEAESLDCGGNNCPTGTNQNSFITDTSFWLGSAYSGDTMSIIISVGLFTHTAFDGVDSCGVRPVIVVNTDDIQL